MLTWTLKVRKMIAQRARKGCARRLATGAGGRPEPGRALRPPPKLLRTSPKDDYCTYMHLSQQLQVSSCMYIYIHMYCICIYVYIYIYKYIYIYSDMYIHVHIYIYACRCINIYTNHIMHVYTCYRDVFLADILQFPSREEGNSPSTIQCDVQVHVRYMML